MTDIIIPANRLHMNKELHRLFTFNNPTWKPSAGLPSASMLARVGFYFHGTSHQIACYVCEFLVLVLNLPLSDPQEKHRQQSPNCRMVCGTATDNIPLISPEGVISQFRTDRYITGTDSLDAAASTLSSVSTFRTIYHLLEDASERLSRRLLLEISENDVIDRSNPDFGRLRYERVRISTFTDWPERANAAPAALAVAGFFYTGTADRVQCAFCRGFLRNWVVGDIPDEEHRKHFPNCPFVRHVDVENVPLNHDNESSLSTSVQQLQLTDTERPHLPRLTIRPLTSGQIPKHPEFSDEEARIASFRGKIVPRGQDVGVLANAGYFHVGPMDNVKCFFCDGGLKNWQANDDPWEEHAKWFPRCGYLTSQRPQEFVRVIQAANQANLVMQQNLPSNIAGTPLALPAVDAAVPAVGRYPVEPREIKARMDSPSVKAVLEMGYSKDLVRHAISNQLSQTGDDFSNATSLVTAVIRLQEQQADELLAALPASVAVQPLPPMSAAAASENSAAAAASVTTSSVASDATATNVAQSLADTAALNPTTNSSASSKSSRSKKRNRKRKAKVNQGDSKEQQPAGDEAGLDDDKEVEGKQEAETEGEESAAASSSAAALISGDADTASLLEENRQLKEAKTCKICMDEEVNVVFLPCGHLACCNNCAPALRHCPICRAFIRGTVRIFLP